MSRRYVGARHVFSTNEQQNGCWQPKNWDAWSYTIIKSYERTFVAEIHTQSCKGACHTLDFLDFILIPKKMIVLILLNRCGLVEVGLGELRKGENELSMKKNTFSLSNYNWVSNDFGDQSRDVMLSGLSLAATQKRTIITIIGKISPIIACALAIRVP